MISSRSILQIKVIYCDRVHYFLYQDTYSISGVYYHMYYMLWPLTKGKQSGLYSNLFKVYSSFFLGRLCHFIKRSTSAGSIGVVGGGDGEQERGVWHAGNRFNQDFSVREIHALVDQIYLGQCGDFALGQ